MDANTLISIIGSVGFPIVAYLGIFWYMIKQNERHTEEIKTMTDAINNNTLALQHLSDQMDGGEK